MRKKEKKTVKCGAIVSWDCLDATNEAINVSGIVRKVYTSRVAGKETKRRVASIDISSLDYPHNRRVTTILTRKLTVH